MRKIVICLCLLGIIALPSSVPAVDNQTLLQSPCAAGEVRFAYWGYSSVLVKTAQATVLIDPGDTLPDEVKAFAKEGGVNVILYTHDHWDHYNSGALAQMLGEKGPYVVAPKSIAKALKKKVPPERLTVCQNGATYTVGGVGVQAIKGKHIGPITLYHLSIGNIGIFHGGDSAYVTLKAYPAHLAFIPVGDPSPTCSPTKACKMALDVAPQVVVAMHGSPSQYESFTAKMAAELPDTRVIIPALSQFQSVSISH